MTTEEKLRLINAWTYTFNHGTDKPRGNRWYAWMKFSSTQQYAIHTKKFNTYEEMIDHALDTAYRFWWDKVNGVVQYII